MGFFSLNEITDEQQQIRKRKIKESKNLTPKVKDIWYTKFYFSKEKQEYKYRPAVIVRIDNNICEILYITSAVKKYEGRTNGIHLDNWKEYELEVDSTCDTSQLEAIDLQTKRDHLLFKYSEMDDETFDKIYTAYIKRRKKSIKKAPIVENFLSMVKLK